MELAKAILKPGIWQIWHDGRIVHDVDNYVQSIVETHDIPTLIDKLYNGLTDNGVTYTSQAECMKACVVSPKNNKFNSWRFSTKILPKETDGNNLIYEIPQLYDIALSVVMPGRPISAVIIIRDQIVYQLQFSAKSREVPIYSQPLSLYSTIGQRFIEIHYNELPTDQHLELIGLIVEPELIPILAAAAEVGYF